MLKLKEIIVISFDIDTKYSLLMETDIEDSRYKFDFMYRDLCHLGIPYYTVYTTNSSINLLDVDDFRRFFMVGYHKF